MIQIRQGDPVRVEAHAVMRSVGTDLHACTPVDLRIEQAAGTEVVDRLESFGEVPIGAAFVTPGGGLRAALLIHVVLRSNEEPISESGLTRAFRNGLRQAAEWEVDVLAVTPLGVGAGNLDAEVSARVMCAVLDEHEGEYDFPRHVLITAANSYEESAFLGEISRRSNRGEVGVEADTP